MGRGIVRMRHPRHGDPFSTVPNRYAIVGDYALSTEQEVWAAGFIVRRAALVIRKLQ